VFQSLSVKEQTGLRAKWKALGENRSLAKPLQGELQGYYRVTYGRIRSVVRMDKEHPVLFVAFIGLRREGSTDDVYEVALKEKAKADPSFEPIFRAHVRAYLQEHELTPPD